ncbi:hypothetical protein ACA910_002208 [Epithemia clementina (nom. ined.)]
MKTTLRGVIFVLTYFYGKSTAIGSGVVLNDPKCQIGYRIQDYKEAVDPDKKNGNTYQKDDTSKNNGKACWSIGTIVLAYLVIALVAHGHPTKDLFFIAIFPLEFNNLGLWGATIGNANILKYFFQKQSSVQPNPKSRSCPSLIMQFPSSLETTHGATSPTSLCLMVMAFSRITMIGETINYNTNSLIGFFMN